MAYSHHRVSRLASSCPKDHNFQFFMSSMESKYSKSWSHVRLLKWFKDIPDDTQWNCLLCVSVLAGLMKELTDDYKKPHFITVADLLYNIFYAVHMVAMFYENWTTGEIKSPCCILGFYIDFLTYGHYLAPFLPASYYVITKLACYFLRLHRPFRYLWALNDKNLKGSIVGTALKYIYIFVVLRISCMIVWMYMDVVIFGKMTKTSTDVLNMAYMIHILFNTLSTSLEPESDYERMKTLMVMLLGCLVANGAAVASLSLVVGLYMRPEEAFRSRFRLIMKDMKDTHVPSALRHKVETFYKMYWHKQKGVSVTQLLPTFPPTLPASIFTDIYFEAQQRSPILRDLSYSFLWEVAKVMSTIHYIPGDLIIHRDITKGSMFYISYGDVEMLTAEDNSTPILRMTRGTILNPCGGCASAACAGALVEIRAATFCTAHVLRASDLWRVALKYGRSNGQSYIINASFEEHFQKVKSHFPLRVPEDIKYKSSIMHFKRNLIALKEAKDEDQRLLLRRNDYFLEVAGSYVMRNRADSSLTDESDAICLRSTFPCIMQPQSSLLFAWNILVSILICAITVVHPYNLVFNAKTSVDFTFFDYMMTGVYVLDLIVHLSTGANVEEGVPITFAQTSSQQVQSPWFVLDVVATLPIFEFVGDGHFAGLNKLLRIPKVFRVLKSMEEISVYYSNALRFMSYSLVILIITYLVAMSEHCFMCYRHKHCVVTNFTKSPFWFRQSMDTIESPVNRITFSLFWAISLSTTTSHFNQVWRIHDLVTLLFNAFVIEILCIVHIFLEAAYSATIMVTSAMRDDYESCIENVKNFLIRHQLDPMVRQRFIQYLQLCWHTDKAYALTHQNVSIYFDLPPHVYQDLAARQRIQFLLVMPMMKLLHEEELKEVSAHMRLFYTSPNEILLNTGDINNEIYIIKRGICEIYNPDTNCVIELISEKKYFGFLECLMRFPTHYTVRAVTHVQVFSIARHHLIKLLRKQAVLDAMECVKASPEYTRVCRRREAFVLYKPPAAAPSKQRFPLPRKHIGDEAYMQPFQRLGFLSVLRYIIPRYTLRPDGQYLSRYIWFRALCALAAVFVFPGYTYLALQYPQIYYFKLFLDLAAYFDIIQRMLVGYYNTRGILVYHPASTAAHYIKSSFAMDLVASLPLESLEYPYMESNKTFKLMSTAQFMMLNRLLQLYRLPNAMNNLSTYIGRRDLILIIKAIPVFLALVNVLTCLLIFYSVEIFYSIDPNVNPPWSIVPLPDKGGSWIHLFNNKLNFNMTASPGNLHLAVLFWVVYTTTSTGYGTFMPSNHELMRILFGGMLTGAMITTYMTVRIISIRANVNKELGSFQEHMKDIMEFMRREKLEKALQREVLDYYRYNWDKMGGLDYREVLKLCDQITLRTDVILHIYGSTFAFCPILQDSDSSLLRVLGRAVRSLYFQEDTVIIQRDDVIEDIYFLDYGIIDIKEGMGSDEDITSCPRGSMFGNLEPTQTLRYPAQMVCTNNVHLLQINSLIFHKIIADFPVVKELMRKCRAGGRNYILGSVQKDKSFSWFKSDFTPVSPIKPQRREFSRMLFRNNLGRIAVSIICLLCMFLDIYNAGFQNNEIWLIALVYSLDLAFIIKVIVKLAVAGHHPDESQHIKSWRRKDYLKNVFKYDVLSLVPIESLCFLFQNRGRAFSLLRLNRAFRCVTVEISLKSYFKQLEINLTVITIITVTVWFTLFIHTMTCTWYFIGVIEDEILPNSAWYNPDEDGKRCDNYYICALYFVSTTFMRNGFGDIIPMRPYEVIYVCILQMLSMLMFVVYVGEFSNIIQYQSFRCFDYYYKYMELREFLKNNRVSANLVKMLNIYSLHLWRESRGMQVPHFLKTAPECLRLKIMSAAYMHHLTENSTFKNCEPAFLRQLVGCLTHYTYCADIYVVKESEITDSMYIIHSGRVIELDEDMDDIYHGKVYVAGECFGMEEGLVRDTPFVCSYRTLTRCQVLTLHLDSWEYLLRHFPASKYSIFKDIPGHKYGRPPDDFGGPDSFTSTGSTGHDSMYSRIKRDQEDQEISQLESPTKTFKRYRPSVDMGSLDRWQEPTRIKKNMRYMDEEASPKEGKELSPGTKDAQVTYDDDASSSRWPTPRKRDKNMRNTGKEDALRGNKETSTPEIKVPEMTYGGDGSSGLTKSLSIFDDEPDDDDNVDSLKRLSTANIPTMPPPSTKLGRLGSGVGLAKDSSDEIEELTAIIKEKRNLINESEMDIQSIMHYGGRQVKGKLLSEMSLTEFKPDDIAKSSDTERKLPHIGQSKDGESDDKDILLFEKQLAATSALLTKYEQDTSALLKKYEEDTSSILKKFEEDGNFKNMLDGTTDDTSKIHESPTHEQFIDLDEQPTTSRKSLRQLSFGPNVINKDKRPVGPTDLSESKTDIPPRRTLSFLPELITKNETTVKDTDIEASLTKKPLVSALKVKQDIEQRSTSMDIEHDKNEVYSEDVLSLTDSDRDREMSQDQLVHESYSMSNIDRRVSAAVMAPPKLRDRDLSANLKPEMKSLMMMDSDVDPNAVLQASERQHSAESTEEESPEEQPKPPKHDSSRSSPK